MSTPADVLRPLAHPSATSEAVAAAVQAFTKQAESSASSIGDYLWEANNAIFNLAGKIAPGKQGKLLDFVVQLQQTNTKTEETGEVLEYHGGKIWTDMPTFGWVARGLLNQINPLDFTSSDSPPAKWENWSSFLAQLTERAEADGPLDFSLFGLWMMRDAFETIHSDEADSAFAARLAAIWISQGGARLRQLCDQNSRLSGNSGEPGDRFADCVWEGFGVERWDVWKAGLKEALGRYPSDDLIRTAAERVEKL